MDITRLSNGTLEAAIAPRGAELRSLRLAGGDELIWQAGPPWARSAPVLFPFVGRLNGDHYRHAGATYEMGQHGFARDRDFTAEPTGDASCRFVLAADDETRAVYPFEFRLVIEHRLEGATLATSFTIANEGRGEMFASIGAHPAFNWPIRPGLPKTDHRIVFDTEEDGPVRVLDQGLMRHEPVPSPMKWGVIELEEGLFRDDAIILQRLASRFVRYEAKGADAPALKVGWEHFDRLGIWSKPAGEGTADFVCIEPWSGNSDPVGFEGDLHSKPGILRIGPGTSVERKLTIEILPAGG